MLLAALILAASAAPERCLSVDHRRVCAVGKDRRGLPLVLFLHGYGGNGTDDVFGLEPLARRGGFIYAWTDALRDLQGRAEWTPGDVPFLTKAIGRLVAKFHADPRRVYLAGFSMGGFMALDYACAEPRHVAAVASLSGTRFEPPRACVPGTVSILQIHGDADDTVHPAGGIGRRTGKTYLSAQKSAEIGAATTGCQALAPARDTSLDLHVQRAAGCRGGAQVELWTLLGVGHGPPPSPTFPNQVWDFLSRARSPAKAGRPPQGTR